MKFGVAMPKSKKYKQYDPWVKAAISSTGRIDLFPAFNIPRMTAKYWIKQRIAVEDPILESLTNALNESREDREQLKSSVAENKALTILLKEIVEIIGFKLRWKHIDSRENRDKILKAITTAMNCATRDACLEILDLSLSRYKRWKREKRGCGLPETKLCPKGGLNQLTYHEIQLMREFVTSKDYAHFPIRSLHYYTKREGILFCTYSTWRKYIDQYGWLRPRKKKRKKITRIGIRAKHPNEIWHMDVSHFILPDGSKCFIQAIIDNFSRYVLAWHVMTSYDGAKSATLLEEALRKSKKIKSQNLRLIVDGGGENKNHKVKKLEDQGHFKKQVARFEISFSNSMVEALFRSIKNNYLYSQQIKNSKSLRKHVNFWFGEHNDRIPHTAFKGETPFERFNQTWDKEQEVRILLRQEDAIKLRIKHNQQVFCQICKAA
jgi:putative transposase